MWVIFVICLLGSVFFAALPLLLWLYYPAAGFEGAAATAGAGVLPHPAAAPGGPAPAIGDNADDEDEADYEAEEMGDEGSGDDDGEAYFEEDAMEEDLDDFDDEFNDDDKRR